MIFSRIFAPPDLVSLSLQPQQKQIFVATTQYAEALANAGPAYTVYTESGELLACLGLMYQWEGYSKAYAFLGEHAGVHMLRLTRRIREWLDARPERRIDCAVDANFLQAHRWAKLCGFKYEGPLEKYFDERDCAQYVRTR